jgi:hypothetical protein
MLVDVPLPAAAAAANAAAARCALRYASTSSFDSL